MPIQVACECGKRFAVADQHAGKKGKCPACGRVIQVPAAQPVGLVSAAHAGAPGVPAATPARVPARVPAGPQARVGAPPSLQYATPGAVPGGPIAPPPAIALNVPTAIPEKLRRPGQPPCHLVFITQGADLNAEFDLSPALQSFADAFAKKLKKRFDVQLFAPAEGQAGAAAAYVRIISMDEGNRWLRYFLGIFFGGTTFEVEGTVVSTAGASTPFHFKHRGRTGLFGGSSLALLKLSGKYLGGKLGKVVLKSS